MFKITKKSKKSAARLGVLKFPQNSIETPIFMPDATRAVTKNLSREDLKRAGLESLVVNTYHLYLQPGVELIKKAGGVHNFMACPYPILSDSGGYQIFSLIHKNKKLGAVSDKKAIFKSPINGSRHEITPEKAIKLQFDLGVDMMVCLDDCPPNNYSEKELEKSVNRTIAWAKRCREEYDKQIKKRKNSFKPLLFGVIQGGVNMRLRKKCADELIKLNFDGLGYGARPIDEGGNFLKEILNFTASLIPENKLRFGLGIGLPEDIVRCVKMGWDMFDCVIPTREGRHGRLFIWSKKHSLLGGKTFYKTININNAKFAKTFDPINPESSLEELRQYSRAYLHHLFKIKDPLGYRLASLNNLEFYFKLIRRIRFLIKAGKF